MNGVMFKPAMIKAIIAGKKTQTRRTSGLKEINQCPDDWMTTNVKYLSGQTEFYSLKRSDMFLLLRPRYAVGQVLYVKEAWRIVAPFTKDPYDFGILYSDGETKWWTDNGGEMDYPINEDKLRSPMFMPAKFARYHIQITGVKFERLQNITEADAIAEGCVADFEYAIIHGQEDYKGGYARDHYADLWDSINPKLPWAMNCWLTAYTFKRVNQ